ncbi:hypothetical protein GRI62_11565 [Erythrobacter arachoides]|uniref:Uncharacterized protein n=1 Tax=Aurantiacibacter arachoides TaxID=1850444 RepID=A0A845A139_9SPHN|nr:hypothetical protein [Aurantiacibacter arachoides]MXO94233.1 hypothetical protein [Aurantiacibacter arachoides]GGD65109.1 hypothetical protein GCM10011411_26760 [Aurantiacibacter arachoides]
MNRDQEIWGMALWVEKHHGADGWLYIAQQQDRLLEQGDYDGMALWRKVKDRLAALAPHDADTPSS